MTCPTSTIDAVFAGNADPAEAHDLFAHLDGCAECRDRYDRELLLQSLLPADQRVTPERRLRATLPLAPAPSRWRRIMPVVAVLAAAACIFLAFRTRPQPDDEFHARGQAVAGPALEVYRLRAGATPSLSPAAIGREDELAFAYTNPNGMKYLAVFALDETGQVYWYYPAWTNAAETPTSIPIRPSASLVELREGIRHDFSGRRVRLYGVWSDAPMTTRAIEERLRGRESLPEHLGWDGTAETSHLLEIQ